MRCQSPGRGILVNEGNLDVKIWRQTNKGQTFRFLARTALRGSYVWIQFLKSPQINRNFPCACNVTQFVRALVWLYCFTLGWGSHSFCHSPVQLLINWKCSPITSDFSQICQYISIKNLFDLQKSHLLGDSPRWSSLFRAQADGRSANGHRHRPAKFHYAKIRCI